jgi:acyl carrier protein/carbonic anhydrase/acetyltransferase-like protein (isoleucine patch superfamily)
LSAVALTECAVRDEVLARVAERLAERGLEPRDVPDDFDLLAEGVVDSFGMLELIGDIEQHFGLSIDFEEIEAVDLTSVGPFSRFVAHHGGDVDGNGHVEAAAVIPAIEASERAVPSAGPAPSPVSRAVGRAVLGAYRFVVRARRKGFSVLSGGAFASFGAHTVLELPIRLVGESRIAIGSGVFVGGSSWLQVLDGHGDGVAISIGDGVSIAGNCVISAVSSIRIGNSASFARNVYIADHAHAYRDPERPILEQGITDVRPVEIGDGAWLGQNVVVLPGVRIGRGAVISANSVVTGNVPDHAVAAGSPARVLSRFA